jgi:activator of HSP90 ATPase
MNKYLLFLLMAPNLQLFADIKYLAEDVSGTSERGSYNIPAGTAVEVNGNHITYKDVTVLIGSTKFISAEEASMLRKSVPESQTTALEQRNGSPVGAKTSEKKKRFIELYDSMKNSPQTTSMMTDKELRQRRELLDEIKNIMKSMTALEIRSAISGTSEEELLRYELIPSQLRADQVQRELEWRNHMKEVNARTDQMLEALEKSLSK